MDVKLKEWSVKSTVRVTHLKHLNIKTIFLHWIKLVHAPANKNEANIILHAIYCNIMDKLVVTLVLGSMISTHSTEDMVYSLYLTEYHFILKIHYFHPPGWWTGRFQHISSHGKQRFLIQLWKYFLLKPKRILADRTSQPTTHSGLVWAEMLLQIWLISLSYHWWSRLYLEGTL